MVYGLIVDKEGDYWNAGRMWQCHFNGTISSIGSYDECWEKVARAFFEKGKEQFLKLNKDDYVDHTKECAQIYYFIQYHLNIDIDRGEYKGARAYELALDLFNNDEEDLFVEYYDYLKDCAVIDVFDDEKIVEVD